MASGAIAVDDILSRVDNLPTLSHVTLRIGELVNDPAAGAPEVAAVLKQDPALSAKLLRLVNSSYYAIPGGVSDVARAISFVGFNTLHQLALSISVIGALKTAGGEPYDARGLWLHSLAVGGCAEVIAKRIGAKDPGSCFTAGLLHDIGKIALAITEGERFASAIELAQRNGLTMNLAEQERGLPGHDRVGSRLARRWKFPPNLLGAIEHHHDVHNARDRIAPHLLPTVDIVALADELVRGFKIGNGGSPALDDGPDAGCVERLGLSAASLGAIEVDLMRRLESSKVFLELI